MRRTILVFFSLISLITATALADEGMWPLYSLDQLPLDTLKAYGLKLQPTDIYNPAGGGLADAVVQLGATGSFVSPDGLMLTNHHVAFGAVQEQSTIENNYLRDGFYAATREQEIPAIGYKAYITLGMEDVTTKVLKGVSDKMPDIDRYKVIDLNIKKIVRDTESGRDVKAKVARMFGGKQYMLYTQFELRDIRIVYVPAEAIGNFGGDIDNWMWPRHTGDFSFLRAYVAPDGKSADFAAGNVPYKPKVYLHIEPNGIREGDFAMTLGFPGSTERYISSYDLANQIEYGYPNTITTFEDEINIMMQAGRRDSAVALRLASDLQGLNNTLKNSYGTMEGFKKGQILERKRAEEQQLMEWLKANPALLKKYGKVLPELDSLYQAKKVRQQHDNVLSYLSWGCDYLRLANSIYRWSLEREKPDLERERGYQQRDMANALERLKNAQTNLIPSVDKEILKYFLTRALQLPPDQKIDAFEKLVAEVDIPQRNEYLNTMVEELYAKSAVGSLDERVKMFNMSRAELEKLNDPFINLAKALKTEQDELRDRGKQFAGAETRLAPKLIHAFAEWKQAKMYPDANGTMRLSYGQVKGYTPRDAITYRYATGLGGVMEKESSMDPFTVPKELSAAYAQKNPGRWLDPVINDVPVDFLTTNDITGGNSGSPVINGEGKLIGVAFDGNWEGVASDYLFAPSVTRTIVVDVRYILYLIDKVYHYDNLMRELGVQTAS
ncbi:MAG: S46 family peptidase [bacterium]|nr:S46 family peptidase [bacterium]